MGCGSRPNVYTTTKDLDRLITALREYAKA